MKFVSGGPKNYVYMTIDTKTHANQTKSVCKVRGVTLNYNTLHMNFEVIIYMTLNSETDYTVTVHTENKINQTQTLGGVVSIITEH